MAQAPQSTMVPIADGEDAKGGYRGGPATGGPYHHHHLPYHHPHRQRHHRCQATTTTKTTTFTANDASKNRRDPIEEFFAEIGIATPLLSK